MVLNYHFGMFSNNTMSLFSRVLRIPEQITRPI